MKVALGTVQFGLLYGIANQLGQVSRASAAAMLQLAKSRGIDTLDTAIGYGESEACLGEIGTQGFKLVTKLPSMPEGCVDVAGWIRQEFNASLSRLGLSRLYGLLLHRPEQLLSPNGKHLYQALRELKEGGYVQKIGISVYSPTDLGSVSEYYRFDLVQAPFNLVDRRLQTSGWMGRLKDRDVEIHTRSTFLQGLLLMPRESIPAKFAPWESLWKCWHQWLMENDVSAVRACLAYPLSFPEIDRVVIGADSESQLLQILNATQAGFVADLPDMRCDEEHLINPARWGSL